MESLHGPLVVLQSQDHCEQLSIIGAHSHRGCRPPAPEAVRGALDAAFRLQRELHLKVGARLILLTNRYQTSHPGLCKGCPGTLLHLASDGSHVVVRFQLPAPYLPKTMDVVECDFSTIIPFDGVEYLCTRRAHPLILGWAVTIHGVQSQTLPVSEASPPLHPHTLHTLTHIALTFH